MQRRVRSEVYYVCMAAKDAVKIEPSSMEEPSYPTKSD